MDDNAVHPADGRDQGALRRGFTVPGHPTVSGSIIGAIGATAFVLVNRTTLPGPLPVVALAATLVSPRHTDRS